MTSFAMCLRRGDGWLGEALSAMHSILTEVWTVARLARFTGMSCFIFTQVFREKVSTSQMEHVT